MTAPSPEPPAGSPTPTTADGSPKSEATAAATFSELPGFSPSDAVSRALTEDGITTPSSPQTASFAAILEGKHVVLHSATGTGKTLAYLLPLLQRLKADPKGRVVCLAPSAELSVQSMGVAKRYAGDDVQVGAPVSGGNVKRQKAQVTGSTRLVFGTPGRVLEMISQKKLKGVTTFVLDEPEPILSHKDARFLQEVLSRPPFPQVILVGATFGRNSAALIDNVFGDDAVLVKTEDRPLEERITHQFVRVRDAADRDLQTARLLQAEKKCRALVYVNQSHLIRHLFRFLSDSGFKVVTLSPDRTKQQQDAARREFARGEAQVLLVTDTGATGLDMDDVPVVVHYEIPRSTEGYVHRAGRTARAGKSGRSICITDDQDARTLRRLEKDLGIEFSALRV